MIKNVEFNSTKPEDLKLEKSVEELTKDFKNDILEKSKFKKEILKEKLGERESIAYFNAIALAQQLERSGAKFEDIALAFYRAIQLNINPETGIKKAADITFSSKFWKDALTKPLADAEKIIPHLIQGNKISGEEIAKHLKQIQERESREDLVGDFGKGTGNTALAVLKACREKELTPTIEGVEISKDLAVIANERIEQAGYKGQIKTNNTDILTFLRERGLEDKKFDAATIIYSLHHLSHNKYIIEALEKGEVSYEDNQYYFTPKVQLTSGENAKIKIPIPSFEKTLADYVDQGSATYINIIKWLEGEGQKPEIKPKIFRDWQQEFFDLLAKHTNPGAKICIFDPNEGVSKGFNKIYLNKTIKEGNLMSGMEIGFASFNNILETIGRLDKAGFKFEKAILQVCIKSEKNEEFGQMAEIQQDSYQPNFGEQLDKYTEDQVADILGYGIIAHKK